MWYVVDTWPKRRITPPRALMLDITSLFDLGCNPDWQPLCASFALYLNHFWECSSGHSTPLITKILWPGWTFLLLRSTESWAVKGCETAGTLLCHQAWHGAHAQEQSWKQCHFSSRECCEVWALLVFEVLLWSGTRKWVLLLLWRHQMCPLLSVGSSQSQSHFSAAVLPVCERFPEADKPLLCSCAAAQGGL